MATLHRYHTWARALVLTVALVLLGVMFCSCAGAPKSLDALNTMPQAQFDSWTQRVGVWTEVLTAETIKKHPEAKVKIQAFGEMLGVFSAQPEVKPTALGDAASQAGLESSLVTLLVLEVQAMIDERGGLPGGERGKQVLGAVANGILLATSQS